jgi:hypothetical protein
MVFGFLQHLLMPVHKAFKVHKVLRVHKDQQVHKVVVLLRQLDIKAFKELRDQQV